MRNQYGFTLAEVITATAIFSILSMGVMTIFAWMSFEYNSVRDRFEAEEAAANAENYLKLVFSQATEVRFDNSSPAGNLGAGPGRVAEGTWDQIADTPGGWVTIANFLREGAGPGAVAGQPVRTAVFYRSPVASAASPRSGVLFIDMGTAAGAMVPDYNDTFIDRVSYLRIARRRHPTFDRIVSIDVQMRFRYHLAASPVKSYCPQLDISGGTANCNPNALWKDLDRSFTILLRNNRMRTAAFGSLLSSSGASEERTLGSLYFFGVSLPSVR